ncbi:MAG: von Willebrand factor type A domain-containing protein [Alphaproteobacteria bacterium]
MERARRAAWAALGVMALAGLAGCEGQGGIAALQTAGTTAQPATVAMEMAPQAPPPLAVPQPSERYAPFEAAGFVVAGDQPHSTFAADVDTVSYARVRRFLADGMLPPADLIRIEEMVNYFAYDYPVPADRLHPFAVSTALAPSPWNDRSQVLRVGIQGFHEDTVLRPPLNLVFLVDVSGSMEPSDRLPLLKRGLLDLLEVLRPVDRVSLVAYAGGVDVVLQPTPGDHQARIAQAIESLRAGGSTNGAGGLEAAYDLAAANYDPKAVNRVILATDGDFNVGASSPDAMGDMVAARRDLGVYITVLGFGTDNLNDALMQAIAQRGDGIAAYVDSAAELRRALSDSTAHTLFPIADDVKIQVSFNPSLVAEYRLLGYETRAITREQFYDDTADGGDISAGHSVTAIYEIVPMLNVARGEPRVVPASFGSDGEPWDPRTLAQVDVRYRLPNASRADEVTARVAAADARSSIAATDADTRFAVAVAGLGLLLRDDPRMLRGFDYQAVYDLAAGALGDDPLGTRRAFLELVRDAQNLSN